MCLQLRANLFPVIRNHHYKKRVGKNAGEPAHRGARQSYYYFEFAGLAGAVGEGDRVEREISRIINPKWTLSKCWCNFIVLLCPALSLNAKKKEHKILVLDRIAYFSGE
jgi:hypothetical protein